MTGNQKLGIKKVNKNSKNQFLFGVSTSDKENCNEGINA